MDSTATTSAVDSIFDFGHSHSNRDLAPMVAASHLKRSLKKMAQERSPLVEAIFNRDDADAARSAIQAGADVNEVYAGHHSLVRLAAYNGSNNVLRVLIESGAKVSEDDLSIMGEMDMTDWKIGSPDEVMDYAEVTRLLIAAGASPAVMAFDGSSLLDYYAAEFYRPIREALEQTPHTETSSEQDGGGQPATRPELK